MRKYRDKHWWRAIADLYRVNRARDAIEQRRSGLYHEHDHLIIDLLRENCKDIVGLTNTKHWIKFGRGGSQIIHNTQIANVRKTKKQKRTQQSKQMHASSGGTRGRTEEERGRRTWKGLRGRTKAVSCNCGQPAVARNPRRTFEPKTAMTRSNLHPFHGQSRSPIFGGRS